MAITITIALPESYVVTSRDRNVSVDVSKLSADIIAKLVAHGVTQKVGDAAANAKALSGGDESKAPDIAESLMTTVARNLEAGKWGKTRNAFAAVSSLDKMMRSIALSKIMAKIGDDDAKLKAWRGRTLADRNDYLDSIIDNLSEEKHAVWTAEAEVMVAEAEAAAARKAKLADDVEVEIDL